MPNPPVGEDRQPGTLPSTDNRHTSTMTGDWTCLKPALDLEAVIVAGEWFYA